MGTNFVVTVGAPGAGKTTINRELARSLNGGVALSVGGDIQKAGEKLAPWWPTPGVEDPSVWEKQSKVIENVLRGVFADRRGSLIFLDGPKTVSELEGFKNTFVYPLDTLVVFCLTAPDDVLLERMKKRGRTEDAEKRLAAHHRRFRTSELSQWCLQEMQELHFVKANQPLEDCLEQFKRELSYKAEVSSTQATHCYTLGEMEKIVARYI